MNQNLKTKNMKYSIKRSFISVVGLIWMPQTPCAMDYTLTQYDIENMLDEDNNITRESVEQWLSTHSGDFSSITDFYADIELPNDLSVVIEWQEEENEMAYNDCMFPADCD